ncbi:MAG TPA: hypothetical protein VGN96_15795 [Roseococcus sp.]|jgi:hypothetical protein|nr:hypothetical protein [Roseococcus sp.]
MSGARFAREIRLAFAPETQWPEVVRRLAAYARMDRDRAIQAGQFSPEYETIVGGRQDAAEETLRPGEVIVYRARALGMAAALGLAELQRRAPRRTGDYAGTFAVAVRGRGGWGGFIRAASFDPRRVGADAEEIVLFSTADYSRKLDVQQVGGRTIRVMVPPGFFSDAAAAVRRAYPAVDAFRSYNVPRGVRWPGPKRTQAGRLIQYPCVMISARR